MEYNMGKLTKKAEQIYDEMNNVEMLLTCLKQSIDICSRDNIEDCTHLLILAEIISEKFEKTICDYEELCYEI